MGIEIDLEAAERAYKDFTVPITHNEGGTHYPMMVSPEMIDEAIRLRAESKTYGQIAKIMQLTNGIVRALIKEGLRTKERETPDEARLIELEKYDALERDLFEIFWANKDGNGAEQSRALRAADRILMLAERRAKLQGLDSPTIIESRPLEMKINGIDIDAI